MTHDDQGKDSTEAQRVKMLAGMVKPLVWQDLEGQGAKASAFYKASYIITHWNGLDEFEVSMLYLGYKTAYDGPRWHKTLKAAKAAVQAHHTARVLADIDTDAIAALVDLVSRAKEELRLIRMKDTGAVYDVLLRTEIDAALSRLGGGE